MAGTDRPRWHTNDIIVRLNTELKAALAIIDAQDDLVKQDAVGEESIAKCQPIGEPVRTKAKVYFVADPNGRRAGSDFESVARLAFVDLNR